MKKLIATAAVALTAITAQPAVAGDADDVVKGILGIVILNEVLNPNNNNRSVNAGINGRGEVYGNVNANNYPIHTHGHTTVINNFPPRDCGYVQNVYRDWGVTRVITTDRCTGRLISERTIYN